MIYYTVVDNYVIPRELKKRRVEDIPGAKLCKLWYPSSGSLMAGCRALSHIEEDLTDYNWFYTEELAVLKVIGALRAWRVLQDEEEFNKWVKHRVW